MDPNPTSTVDSIIDQTLTLSHNQTILRLHSDPSKTLNLSTHALYGKVIADMDLKKKPIIPKLLESWNLLHEVQASCIGTNTYLFHFASAAEKRRIFLQKPWSVLGFHLVLKPWLPNLIPEEIDFSTTELWVQVHNVPLDHHTEENAKLIGPMFKRLLEIEILENHQAAGHPFMRIKVEHQVEEPLKSGFYMERELPPHLWVQFRYERVSNFCFNCGRLGHTEHSCTFEVISEIPKQERKNGLQSPGPWMLVPRKKNSYQKSSNDDFDEGKVEGTNLASKSQAEQVAAARGKSSLVARENPNPSPLSKKRDDKSTASYTGSPPNPPSAADLSLGIPAVTLDSTMPRKPCTNLPSESLQNPLTTSDSLSTNTGTVSTPSTIEPTSHPSPISTSPTHLTPTLRPITKTPQPTDSTFSTMDIQIIGSKRKKSIGEVWHPPKKIRLNPFISPSPFFFPASNRSKPTLEVSQLSLVNYHSHSSIHYTPTTPCVDPTLSPEQKPTPMITATSEEAQSRRKLKMKKMARGKMMFIPGPENPKAEEACQTMPPTPQC